MTSAATNPGTAPTDRIETTECLRCYKVAASRVQVNDPELLASGYYRAPERINGWIVDVSVDVDLGESAVINGQHIRWFQTRVIRKDAGCKGGMTENGVVERCGGEPYEPPLKAAFLALPCAIEHGGNVRR